MAVEVTKLELLQSGGSIVRGGLWAVMVGLLTIGCGGPVSSNPQESTPVSQSNSSKNLSRQATSSDTPASQSTNSDSQESPEAATPPEANQTTQTVAQKDSSSSPTQATIEAFIPAGWQVAQQISGDLNGDRRQDAVLKLSRDGQFDLIVLLATSSGWQQLAHAPNLLLCGGCAGPLGTNQGGHIRIEIEDDVLLVKQIAGSRGAVEIVHRFWIDRPSDQLVLIGEDVNPYDRANGNEIRDSRNFLTGKRIIEEYRGNPDGGGKELIRTQTLTVSRQLQPIDAIDIEQVRSSAPELPGD